MTRAWQVLLLVCLPLLAAAAAEASSRGVLAGEWVPIETGSAHIQDLASFAVGEHNREAKTLLVYRGVVAAESNVSNPSRYRLTVQAADNGVVGKYEAEVWEESPRRLVSFKPVSP